MMPAIRFLAKGKMQVMSILSIVVLCSIFGLIAFEASKAAVTVVLDGKKRQVKVHAETVGQLLADLGIDVQKHDEVRPGLKTRIREGMKVIWEPARRITVVKNGSTKEVWTTADTVREFVQKQALSIGEHDVISPAPSHEIKENMKIVYKDGFQVNLVIGEKKRSVHALATMTVGDLLQQNSVQLNKYDYVRPAKDTPLTAGMAVKVIRIKKITEVVEESVDYGVITRKDDSLPKGEKKIVQDGKKGRIAKHYVVTLKNGKEVARKLIKTVVVEESQDKIVAVGTKEFTTTVSRSKDSSSGVRQFYVTASAYTANCAGCSGYTSTGINLHANPDAKVIAVDPDVIPLGTRVYVEGYGYAVAADTGGAIDGRHIDVFFPTKAQAYAWGVRKVLIKILE